MFYFVYRKWALNGGQQLAEEYEEVIIPEEYIEVEKKIKEISLIDFSEFIVKTELWYRFLEGSIPIDELAKIMTRRRAARIKIKKKIAEAKKKPTKKTKSKKSSKRGKKTGKSRKTTTKNIKNRKEEVNKKSK